MEGTRAKEEEGEWGEGEASGAFGGGGVWMEGDEKWGDATVRAMLKIEAIETTGRTDTACLPRCTRNRNVISFVHH